MKLQKWMWNVGNFIGQSDITLRLTCYLKDLSFKDLPHEKTLDNGVFPKCKRNSFYLTVPTRFRKFQIRKSHIVCQCSCILSSTDLLQDWKISSNGYLLGWLKATKHVKKVILHGLKVNYSAIGKTDSESWFR